ncbi:MAG: SpaA isopeptide-forming pilin-related protein [Silanimonas sp.]|nr:SpaA isopeptide-forming pilin-related protein [Silanimonas sp.]
MPLPIVVPRGRVAALRALVFLALASAPVAAAYDLQFAFIRDDQSPAPSGSDPTPAGGTIVYDVRIENSAADSIGNVQTVFDVPAGTTPVSLPGNCSLRAGPPAQVVCTHGTLVGTLAAPTPGSPVDFQLRFQATAAGTVTLRGAIGVGSPPASPLPLAGGEAFFGTDTNIANNNSSQATTVTTGADLSITKTDSPDPVNGGERISYTVMVTNAGPNDAAGVRVRDTLSSSTSYVAGSANGAGWTFSHSGGVLTAARAATLANGASASFTYQATVNVGSGNVANSAVVDTTGGSATPDFDPNNNTAIANTTVNPGADASITKLVSATPVVEGSTVTFTLRPRNAGPSVLSSAVVSDTLPAGFSGVAITSSPNWACAFSGAGNSQLDCTRASVPVGTTDNIVFTATTATGVPGNGQVFTNTGSITSATPDPSTSNNSGSVNLTVLPDGADLQITGKTRDRNLVAIGAGAASRIASTIVVRNNGPQVVSSNLVVTDELEASETFVSSSGPWSCAAAGAPQVVTCTYTGTYPVGVGTTLDGGNALVITTEAVAADTDIINTACVGGSGGSAEPVTPGPDLDPNTSNDCTGPGSGTTATTQSADLALAKVTSTPVGGDKVVSTSESSVTYTLTVTNNGANATTGIVITDPLPGFRTSTPATPAPSFDLAGAPGWSCSMSSGTATCRSNATSLASGGSATIGITVQRPINDSAGNNATCNGATQPNAFCNTAVVAVDRTVAGALGDADFSDNTAEDHVTVERVSNVRTTANVVSPSATGQVGVNATFRIDYLNAGPSVARGVVYRATIDLPANDTGFVLTSLVNSGGTACSVATGPGVTTAAGAGGTSYANPSGSASAITITCGALDMVNQNAQNLQVTLRPNFGAAGPYTAVGDFTFGSGSSSGSDAQGAWDYNSVAGAADDERSATLTLTADQINLLTNKTDLVDPVGFDPSDFTNNRITYRVSVRNLGPSVASSVSVADTITPPAGKTLRYLGASTSSSGPFVPARCTQTSGANPSAGAPMGFSCVMPGAGFTPNVDGVVGVNQVAELFLAFQYETAPNGTGDTLSNTATAAAAETDTDLSNNADAEDTTIRSRADLSVAKFAVLTAPSADPTVALPANTPSVTLRQPFFYVVEGTNNGPGLSISRDRSGSNPLNGTGTVVTDSLPIGLRVTGPATWQKVGDTLAGAFPDANGSGTCAPPAAIPFTVVSGSQTLTCNVGDLTFLTGTPGRVRVIIPAEWVAYPPAATGTRTTVTNGAAIATEQIDPTPGNNGTTRDTDVTRATLAGTVFQDRDRAGANGGTPQAAGPEPRIAGVTLTLTGTDTYGNVLSGVTATTDASGNYLFANLAPSNAAGYTVTQTQPTGFANGPVDPPAFGTATGPSLTAGTPAYQRPAVAGNSAYAGVVVGTDEAGVRYSFPELRQPVLSGTVYVDGNFSNAYDAGTDTTISGAPLRLLDATGATVLASSSTNGAGLYQFDFAALGLDPSATYVLEEPLPGPTGTYLNRPAAVNPGLVGGVACVGCAAAPNTPAAGTDRITGINLGSGLDGTQFNFGEDLISAPGGTSLSGFVYVDRNNNGSFEAGGVESGAGIAGVTITLAGPGGPITTTTDANGFWSFTGLVVGANYTVTETQPPGYNNGLENPSNVITINNLPLAGSTGNNFGEIAGSLAGVVYLDANNNGQREAGENGIPGVQMTLSGTGPSGAIAPVVVTTQADGSYRFADLVAGTYTVTQQAVQPVVGGVTTIDGDVDAGNTGGTVSPTGTSPSRISDIVLPAGVNSTSNNFAEILPVAISGRVYLDADNDGVIDGGEAGIGGQLIRVIGTDDRGQPVTVEVTTQSDGSYTAPSLRPGTYTITQPNQPPNSANGITTPGTAGGTATTPATTPSAISTISLTTPGGSSTGNNFGEIPNNASIAGRVWLDTDNDGVIDAGERGIANVTVVLTGTDVNGTAVNVTLQTDADGRYVFTGLLPGTYTVTEPTQPAGTANGRTVPGSTGGTGTPVTTTPSAITTIPLAAGQASVDHHFGEVPVSSIAGSVYNDRDNDGVRDTDEPGYAGIVVRLTGTDDLGNAVSIDLTTDAGGRYRFTGLRPGTYTVTELAQPVDTSNGITTPGSTGGTATPVSTVPSAIGGIIIGPGVDSVDNNFGEIGDTPDVVVSKSATPTRFATNAAGSYTIRVRNQGQRPSVGEILVRDRLPTGLRLTAAPTGTGWTCSGAANDERFECRSSSVIGAASTSPNAITVPVRVAAGIANGTTLNNAVMVSGGGEPEFRGPTPAERGAFEGDVSQLPVCDPAITQNACRTPTVIVQSAALSGSVWYDIGSSIALRDGGDRPLQGWTVELVDPATGRVIATQATGPDGRYRFADLTPGLPYVVRFREPGGVLWGFPVNGETTPNSPARCDRDAAIAGGTQSSCVRRNEAGITEIEVVLAPGRELVEQSLPVDPNGVVYDAVTRQPVPGSVVTLAPVGICAGFDPATQLLNAAGGGYRISGSSIAMTVGVDGFYQFLFAPTAPARCTFQLTVTPPPTHTFVSTLIPPQAGTLNPPGGPTNTFYVQPQGTAPTVVPGTGTQYWLVISTGSTAPNIVHNHLPLDPRVAPGLSISKSGDRQIAEVGDTVLYTLTVRQTAGSALPQLSVLDVLPPGFTYIAGTARVDGVAVADPVGAPGSRLGFSVGSIPAGGQRVVTYRVRVGVGSQQGDGVNRATAVGCGITAGCLVPGTLVPVGGSIVSNEAQYRVRVTGGVFASEACVLGKVFVDCDRDSLQGEEELGIPGVRLYFSDGTFAITDVEGKYSYCGIEPRSATLKVDGSTLPRGAVLTTSSNRNLGDANSLFLDLKNGELHRADFIEGSCSNRVLEQVRARRGNGEVRAPESEPAQPGLRFESKPAAAPQQATDGANQPPEQPRARNGGGAL